MNNQVYRIVSCYGKEYIVEDGSDLFYDYDIYNLDRSKYYVEEMNRKDERIRGKPIYPVSRISFFKKLRRSQIPKITVTDIDERIDFYLRYPLSIFLNINDLKNI